MVELVPVIEFEPSTYHLGARPSPTSQSPEEWDRYWSDSLADAGIDGIKPFKIGSWFVSVDQLQSREAIRILLSAHCQGSNTDDLEELSAFSGGYFFTADTKSLPPQCCGDLSNLNDWRRAASHRKAEWLMLWIGHPWTHIFAENDRLTILEPTEEDPPVTREPVVSFERSELLSAISRSEKMLGAFQDRLHEVVTESFSNSLLNHDEIVRVLLSGH